MKFNNNNNVDVEEKIAEKNKKVKKSKVIRIIICIIFIAIVSFVYLTKFDDIGQKLQEKDQGIAQPQLEDLAEKEEKQLEMTSTKIEFTDEIKNEILELVPGLFNYNEGDVISDENKGNFIYNAFSKIKTEGYVLNKKTIGGKEFDVLEVAPTDVNDVFMDAFDVEVGIYMPELNSDNPTVYYKDGLYQVCVNNTEDTYAYVSSDKEKENVKIVYEKTTKEQVKTTYTVYIRAADNNTGYAITKVIIEPSII
ncbi:MAG: hypothetical protein E7262_04720 [Lachnospiraceae bacterium]|nr:hypothetical protein [Lachnospiraceae bacterium]